MTSSENGRCEVETVMDRVSLSVALIRQEVAAQPTAESQALLEEVRKLKALVQSITSERQKTAICVKPRRFAEFTRQ